VQHQTDGETGWLKDNYTPGHLAARPLRSSLGDRVLLSSYTETAVPPVIIDALVHGTRLPIPSPKHNLSSDAGMGTWSIFTASSIGFVLGESLHHGSPIPVGILAAAESSTSE